MTDERENQGPILDLRGRPPARAVLALGPEDLSKFLDRVSGKDGLAALAAEVRLPEGDLWILREWAKGYLIVLRKRDKSWAKAEETCSKLWRRMPRELTG